MDGLNFQVSTTIALVAVTIAVGAATSIISACLAFSISAVRNKQSGVLLVTFFFLFRGLLL